MSVPPLVILGIGIVTVVGMIIVLRINAFIALITAAIVVSLLAPGEVSEKISRVADAFGETAAEIGIVIALAAVIGKCMMDSGAADRVVRAFLNWLGEKRASYALMGSGFVLAVPVFFDTVFYLLVPLARSLFKRTSKNYLMYILAIAAGGAITHTLVPPTPGPLLMASNLNIDIGLMMIVGAIVAVPAAFAGIIYAKVTDGVMEVPMRPVGSEPEPEPLEDHQLPSLLLSVLPVVLPVLMISTNTILTAAADAQRAARFGTADVSDWELLREELLSGQQPAPRIRESLSAEAVRLLQQKTPTTDEEKRQVVAGLNRAIGEKSFFDPAAFESAYAPAWKIELSRTGNSGESTTENRVTLLARQRLVYDLWNSNRARMNQAQLERFHRLLLEVSYPEAIRPHTWKTPVRQAANVSSLFGNANLALLVSAAIAIVVLYQQRRPTLTELSKTVETSLMSGGAIILITAGGGAFGEMLKTAQIGPAIETMFTDGGQQASGLMFLLLGFGVAALLKVAQGSSTVAMITASAMLAAMIGGVETLGYNTVYLATAIGAGSLIGSWMNDSGFWIFAKMGGLTEMEALKSWTPMLVVLGLVSMAMTLLLVFLLPLTSVA